MTRTCVVPGCKSNYKSTHENVSVFRFPKDPVRRREWLSIIGNRREHSFKINDNSVVCIKHFEDADIVRETRLSTSDGAFISIPRKIPKLTDYAFPSIFPNEMSYNESSAITPNRTDPQHQQDLVMHYDNIPSDRDKQDLILTFSHFCSHFKDKNISNFSFNVHVNEFVQFYRINLEGMFPKVLSGFKIFNNLRIEIYMDDLNIPISKFKWLLGHKYICDRWSKFEKLISYLNKTDLDSYANAKRLGASYCIVQPAKNEQVSSNRTKLCKEVLNDQWVSFPTLLENNTFVDSYKTQYEDYMHRCEDERFEMDVLIENNASTIRVLENIQKKINSMEPEEAGNFSLDHTIGGTSGVLYQRALKQIYGEKTNNIIDGLKSNPAVAIGTILTRLKSKETEWREAQKDLNKIWREQNEKYYLKSLDHQGINFKKTDLKALMSNSLFNDIETLFHERHEQNKHGREVMTGPHIVIPYKDRSILDDAADLLIHYVKRKTNIQNIEKNKIKELLLRTVPNFFFHPRHHLSDDEGEDEKQKDECLRSCSSNNNTKNPRISPAHIDVDEVEEQRLLHAKNNDTDEAYTLFVGNNNWYIFLRLHAILCDRLGKIYERSVILVEEEAKQQSKRKESTAISLRLKQQLHIEVQEYYPAFLDIVKTLLDGNIDSDIYEDTLREMYGIYAYIAFTLDSVISYAVRQLQHCVTEKTASACTDLFMEEQKKGESGGPCKTAYKRADAEFAYQRAAQKAILDEKCFKFCFYKKECTMSIELLETINDDIERVQEKTKLKNE